MGKIKPIIVISAINIFNAGPLSILIDCLRELNENYSDDFEIYALVYKDSLFDFSKIKFIPFPYSRSSYLFRIYYEFFYFKKLSKKINPYLWLSLHDITPNVNAIRRAVYCHNVSGFYKASFKDFLFSPVFYLFTKFYNYVYRINIKSNDFVIVQQNWLKNEFIDKFKLNSVLVASPNFQQQDISNSLTNEIGREYSFIYPSFPRSFKNFEIIANAILCLKKECNLSFKVYITIDGSENLYSKYIIQKYYSIKEIEFLGIQSRNKIFELYSSCNCLLFPSKLESWGLPLSEFKMFNKPILVSDLPYAHETVGDYDKVCFFNPDSPDELASYMIKAINGDETIFKKNELIPTKPDASNWKELFEILIEK